VNSKFDGFEIQTGPILPVFTEFQKIRPVFLTLVHTACMEQSQHSRPWGAGKWRHMDVTGAGNKAKSYPCLDINGTCD
jgi:hypothetical protein